MLNSRNSHKIIAKKITLRNLTRKIITKRTRKKDLDELIKRINTRVKANPNVYSEDAIASLGHGKGIYISELFQCK